MASDFNTILNSVLGIEGGYVNDVRDSGGATRYGITEGVARSFGYTGSMRTLPLDTARDIYRLRYWRPIQGDALLKVSPALAHEVFDSAVNCGVSAAGKWLQRALNVLNNGGAHWPDLVEDGAIGRATLAALDALVKRRGAAGVTVLVRILNALQGQFYVSLAERRQKDEAFVFGWFTHRVA